MQVWKNHVEGSSAAFTSSLIDLCDRFPVICEPIVCISLSFNYSEFSLVNSHNTIVFEYVEMFQFMATIILHGPLEQFL